MSAEQKDTMENVYAPAGLQYRMRLLKKAAVQSCAHVFVPGTSKLKKVKSGYSSKYEQHVDGLRPDEAEEETKWGWTARVPSWKGDRVQWVHSDKDVPEGAVGTVMGFTVDAEGEHLVNVMF